MRRDNNFDILRLIFSWTVVLAHCGQLSSSPVLLSKNYLFQSGLAVEGFFAISGCLIAASWDRTRSTLEYFRRRAKRILPAYYAAILFCVLLGCCFTTLPLTAFLKSPATWKYLVANLVFMNFLHPSLPGVFASNPFNAMDGALWTIKIEVGFYLCVPLIIWGIRRFGKALALSSVGAASLFYEFAMVRLHHPLLSYQLPGELKFFVVGMAVYYYFPQFEKHRTAMWCIALICLPACWIAPWWLATILFAISIPLTTLCIAFLLPPYRGITKYGDFSYGTYVFHFPIIQAFVFLGYFAHHAWGTVAVLSALVACVSVLSWFGVERVFLNSGRVRQQESETTAVAV